MIKAFGMVAEKIGSTELILENMPQDTQQLMHVLFTQFPQLEGVKFAIAVDRKIVHGMTTISPGQEIALLPPFSGG
jgi:molybdopterin synthase sulfur carrier subunit